LASPPEGFERVAERPEHTYILAPSLHHAASAAVLRSGFDSHGDKAAFGINLESGRARLARWLVDGVRNQQPLSVLLGYWFERSLHDVQKDELIDDVREQFPTPIVEDPDNGEATLDARVAIGARHVVDGLALYRALTGTAAHPLTPTQAALLPRLNTEVPALVRGLADVVDAVGDLLVSESVHQLVAGNPLRAGLAADTLGRGESLPSRFDMITSPRSGVGLTCSVAVVVPTANADGERGWNTDRPRARLAPAAELWASVLLGTAASWRVACTVTRDGSITEVQCGLDDLAVCALDVVFDIPASGRQSGALASRIISVVGARAGSGAAVALASGDASRPWRTLESLVARIRRIFAAARPLQASDVDPLHPTPNPMIDGAEFAARLTALGGSQGSAQQALTAASSRLARESQQNQPKAAREVALAAAAELAVRANHFLGTLAQAMQALRAAFAGLTSAASEARVEAARAVAAALVVVADHGVENSYPVVAIESATDVQALAEQARLVIEALDRVAPAQLVAAGGTPVNDWTNTIISILSGVVGDHFPIAAAFAPMPGGELAGGLAAPREVPGAEPPEVMTWLRRMGRVRSPLSDFHDVMLAIEFRTRPAALPLKVLQAPHGHDEPWAVHWRPVAVQRTAVLHIAGNASPEGPFCGWLIDAWTERVPGLSAFADVNSPQTELAGLTFHYNQPDARPPHAILFAVPPDPDQPWGEATLLQVLSETLDLAKIRSVEHRDLPRNTPLVPATYVLASDSWPAQMNPAVTDE
jgi:hypothetical protein